MAGDDRGRGGVGVSAIRVEVTAEHIAACPRLPETGDGYRSGHPDHYDPVELALTQITGCEVRCDQDEDTEMATIGNGVNVLVLSLPIVQARWIDRWYRGDPIEPFAFDVEIEDWLVAMVARAAVPA